MARLDLLAAEARKYSSFEEFSKAYSLDCMRGQYWHVTDDPNFSIKRVHPSDLSTLSPSGRSPEVGLMVSCDPALWHAVFSERRFAAQIDLSRAFPVPSRPYVSSHNGLYRSGDYQIVDRGFGHEVFVNNLDAVSVIRVVSIGSALRSARYYNEVAIPQSRDDLFDFWVSVHEGFA